MVLSIAAFGKPMTWKTGFSASSANGSNGSKEDNLAESLTSGKLAKGHKQTFTYALYMVSTHLLEMFSVPSWSLVFTKKLREMRRSFNELQVSNRPVYIQATVVNMLV
jgi:hypothetical protein